ncbi:MAG: HEAT repeat domain-containing protein [Anaerolineae bacterium]|nr:HEAT repeat domain-containing protein [Anaerolineae bacterium]
MEEWVNDMDEMLSDDEFTDEDEVPVPFGWLMEQLNEQDPETRIQAVSALWDHVEPEAMERLFDMAQNDPDERVRCKAISGLGRYIWECTVIDFDFPDPYQDDDLTQEDLDRLRSFLLGLYRDEGRSLDERRYAVEALSFLPENVVIDLIQALYQRPEKQAKISALFSMGRSGIERWEKILAREIWSEDKEIRIEAIDAVGEMRVDSLGKDLWRLTYDPDRDVMMAALFSLGQTGWEEAFERLDELTLHPDPEVRQVADAALEEWMLFSQMGADLENGDEEQDEDADWM